MYSNIWLGHIPGGNRTCCGNMVCHMPHMYKMISLWIIYNIYIYIIHIIYICMIFFRIGFKPNRGTDLRLTRGRFLCPRGEPRHGGDPSWAHASRGAWRATPRGGPHPPHLKRRWWCDISPLVSAEWNAPAEASRRPRLYARSRRDSEDAPHATSALHSGETRETESGAWVP